ncbi:muscle M-line assembly protein unc-89-like [Diprion similis]|uniref:muscle M-line assembly protein unc-89-like n=1 Tax=Diprion similis TaxID=362088 RepID=UPI001EF7B578|nr:muscle M-line assembly protein unc-89-like [Diprion similis]
MEDEIDIYADLPSFNLGDNENPTEANKEISEKCATLEKQVADLTQSLESLRKVNKTLEVNISSLLQTARAEIARKDRMISEIRQELDYIRFRRGEYSRPTIQDHQSLSRRRKREKSSEEEKYVQVQEVTETIDPTNVAEVTSIDLPSNGNDDSGDSFNKTQQIDGISTVFGRRLHKKILESQQEERKRKVQSTSKGEENQYKNFNSDDQTSQKKSQSKPDSLKLYSKTDKLIAPLPNKGTISDSTNNSGVDNHRDRKRCLEGQFDGNNQKRLKTSETRSNYGDSSRHGHRIVRSAPKNQVKNKTDDRRLEETNTAKDPLNQYRVVDEYSAPVEDGSVSDDESVDRHNRVAIRLMLLSEGIDPDLEENHCTESDANKMNEKKNEATSRSRSKSKDCDRRNSKTRRHNYISRSRSPDEYYKGRRQSRHRDQRQKRNSRDRFERRNEVKNKDGDNLSEFSREIHDLRETIEHRIDERSGDRGDRGRSFNKNKRNDERVYKNCRSRTPNSSRSCSKERTVHQFRGDRHSRRSRSRERYKSRHRKERYPNVDNLSNKTSSVKSKLSITERSESIEVETSKRQSNPETKSLVSLEEGEIVDSVECSPVKLTNPTRISTENIKPSKLCLSDSNELESKIFDVKSPLPLKEIGNTQNNHKRSLVENLELSFPESTPPVVTKDSLNLSKDERIENIAEFIANFSPNRICDLSDNRTGESSSDGKIIEINPCVEKKCLIEEAQNGLHTVLQSSLKDGSPVLPPTEAGAVIADGRNKVSDNNGGNDWCLIAIDSPVKNFEENRKTRMMAVNLLTTVNLELPNGVSCDPSLPKNSPNTSETSRTEELQEKIVSQVAEVIPQETATSAIRTSNNSSPKSKPAGPTTLRSTYYKCEKREIILSDTNSEHSRQTTSPQSLNLIAGCLDEHEATQQSANVDTSKTIDSEHMSECKTSQSLIPMQIDEGSTSGENQGLKDLCGDEDKVKNVDNDKPIETDTTPAMTSLKKVIPPSVDQIVNDTNKKSEKSKASNNSKSCKETATKNNGNVKPERRNSAAKESKSKQTISCKADVPKSISSKNKSGNKVAKTDEIEKSNCKEGQENGSEPAKLVPKSKIEGTNAKVKKEPPKLIIYTRRRRPVHLEDCSMSLSILGNSDLVADTTSKVRKSITNEVEHSAPSDTNKVVLSETKADDESAIDRKSELNSDKCNETLETKEDREASFD